jgi:hypothetical protein
MSFLVAMPPVRSTPMSFLDALFSRAPAPQGPPSRPPPFGMRCSPVIGRRRHSKFARVRLAKSTIIVSQPQS